ncbi:type II toxin-antitoxin system CcdA family antitoxin [Methanoregula sp.]|uniref:type II toxin-antitoxin system CcdA family antitoxin n=1 Tax=Methanoregula sp. TaxID=2052170 RepID=UPI003C77BE0D
MPREVKMVTLTIRSDGEEFIHTNVTIPRHIRDLAKERGISLSKELRTALEKKIKEGDAGAKQLPTNEAPASLSNTDKQVDV